MPSQESPISSQTVRLHGEAVRMLREGKGLTQLYIAEVVGVTVDTVSRWENNRTTAVRRDNALALATALEVEIERLLRPREVPESADIPDPAEAPTRTNSKIKLSVAVGFFLLIAGGVWWALGSNAPSVEAHRRLPSYGAPGQVVPVVVEVRLTSGKAERAILRERLPRGWVLKAQTVPPDSGPSTDGLVRWILPLEHGAARVAYLLEVPLGAPEGTAYRLSGEVVTALAKGKVNAVEGPDRIDAEYVHWADENGDFSVSDAELLEALDKVSVAPRLDLDPEHLRALWGATSYEWDKTSRRFVPKDTSSEGHRP